MENGNTSSSNSDNNVEEINKADQNALWNSVQRNLQAILGGQEMDCTFEELYGFVETMYFTYKSGRLVYDGTRQMVKQHIDKKVVELEQMATHQRNNQVMLQVDQFWFHFSNRMEKIRYSIGCLELFMVRDFVDGGEESLDYAWRFFHTEILENQFIKNAMANRLMLNVENNLERILSDDTEEFTDYKESPLFNVDTIIEIMSFLGTFKLGLQVSTAARQMAKLSDYVLNKRKRILPPIVIWNGIEGEMEMEPFATHLQKGKAFKSKPARKNKEQIYGDWFTNKTPENRICLPDIDPPEWLTGVEIIYLMDGMHDKTFCFLNALRNHLQNCQLVLNVTLFSEFFAKLQSTGHSAQFFELFNERCFSLSDRNDDFEYKAKWPRWALFNNIFFPNCRELTLSPHSIEEKAAAKWLMHSSTEHQPRLLRLQQALMLWFGEEMLKCIKEDFFNPTGRRMFFVEIQRGSIVLPALQKHQGEWQNGIGEQLRIDTKGIIRLPVDQWHKSFKDFYELPVVPPKVVFK